MPQMLHAAGTDFYPRPPRGGRHTNVDIFAKTSPFLSTPSARRATAADSPEAGLPTISIHALREEGDLQTHTQKQVSNTFLSTPSARRATNANGH